MEQKEQNKNPTVSPKEEKPKTPLTEEQRQKRRKMLVYPLMGLLFAGSMWLIFAPSDKDKAEAQLGVGFNTEMPLPVEAGIIPRQQRCFGGHHRRQAYRLRAGEDGGEAERTADADERPRCTILG